MNNSVIKTKVIGVDINVRETTLAIVDIRGNIIAKDAIATTDYKDINSFLTALSEQIIMLAEQNGGYEHIRSIGISAPSANFLTGCIENASNMPWKGVIPLAAMLRDRLGIAVAVANDAHVTAMGEKTYGSAHGMSDFVVISLGHGGLGSCFFCNKQPHLGNNGFAGEFGHTCIKPDGRLCGCGRKGCLEQYVSANGIVQTAREMMEATDAPSLMRTVGTLSPTTIVDCCEQGDEMAIEVFNKTGQILGTALASYASIINPEAIILTGELTKTGHWLTDPMEQSFDENVFQNTRGKVRLLISILEDSERDVLGASAIAWEVKEYSLFK